MISQLKGVIPPHFLKQRKEMLVFNQPKLTLPDVSAHFNELQKVAGRIRFTGVDLRNLKPTRANFINGIWTVCNNGHVHCKPRGQSMMDNEMWKCPDCPS